MTDLENTRESLRDMEAADERQPSKRSLLPEVIVNEVLTGEVVATDRSE